MEGSKADQEKKRADCGELMRGGWRTREEVVLQCEKGREQSQPQSGGLSTSATIECGEDAAKHFAFERSYGTHPIDVAEVRRKYLDRAEARPDTFVRYEYRSHLLNQARQAIADYVHAPLETCVLIPNATTGIETVLRNLDFAIEDAHPLPVTDHDICSYFEQILEQVRKAHRKPKLAIFDTISSQPGIRWPFKRLTDICRKGGILSCIDGAHGVGQIPLDLPKLDPDFFVSNCHKWLHTPRGCALLYVPVRNQHLIRSTLPTGFAFVKKGSSDKTNNFVANFAAVATSDDTPYLCIPAAVAWRKRLTFNGQTGEDAIMNYNKDLARRGGKLVADILGTEVMDNAQGTLGDCAMVNVRLPIDLENITEEKPNHGEDIAGWINKTMNLQFNIAVNAFVYADVLWVRLSAQVYLEMKHFEAAGNALNRVCCRVRLKEWNKEASMQVIGGIEDKIGSTTEKLHPGWALPFQRE
ncbi:PLP-dependent transferase [Aureobasidium pullulans]|uniref:PLP-dependent transferase n=1 Tax=Aureobasidium pullulans TaxID=5580 RepID=A0A4S9XP31_AURPU|nr:PLP-dependent transferase [Aureobasidium pullulans]